MGVNSAIELSLTRYAEAVSEDFQSENLQMSLPDEKSSVENVQASGENTGTTTDKSVKVEQRKNIEHESEMQGLKSQINSLTNTVRSKTLIVCFSSLM